jgi:Lrp/AsnC family leucine-responsive transcriptional regulator
VRDPPAPQCRRPGDTRGCPRIGTANQEDDIDAVDEQLLALLQANGRASYAELARQVGLSAPAVHERVGKLESAGVITGYTAVVDPAAVGLGVTALIGVIDSDEVDDVGILEAMSGLPHVEDCWRTAGTEGYVLKVRVTDIPALEDTINALNRIRGVARTRTTVVLSTKWEGRHGRAE